MNRQRLVAVSVALALLVFAAVSVSASASAVIAGQKASSAEARLASLQKQVDGVPECEFRDTQRFDRNDAKEVAAIVQAKYGDAWDFSDALGYRGCVLVDITLPSGEMRVLVFGMQSERWVLERDECYVCVLPTG